LELHRREQYHFRWLGWTCQW